MRILAVDDDPVFLELLLGMLRVQGHEDVTTAGSGQEALAMLGRAAQPFDCLLLDIQMPGMSGVQLCHAVRQIDAYRRTPVVMITAMSGKSFVDDAFTAGATDYVTKPLDRLDLKARLGMVERLLAERREMAAYAHKAGLSADATEAYVDFAAPMLIPGVERGIEYLALENYLLTLGIKRMFSLTAFGIHVENAAVIFGKANSATFLDMLGDVATVILDGLKTEQVLLAYAGNGNFVGLAREEMKVDPEDLEIMINVGLMEFEGLYATDRLPLPRVKVGGMVRSSIFGSSRPRKILDQAILLAQPKQEQKSKKLWLAA